MMTQRDRDEALLNFIKLIHSDVCAFMTGKQTKQEFFELINGALVTFAGFLEICLDVEQDEPKKE